MEPFSCIDLFFTSIPSFISASGGELSLYDKCHHNLIYGKINFTVPLPPSYIREVWDYKNAEVEKILSNQFLVLTGILFSKEKLNLKVNVLNKCLLNVFEYFISQ